jgi:hypothetical protein
MSNLEYAIGLVLVILTVAAVLFGMWMVADHFIRPVRHRSRYDRHGR